ncbi:MAG: hypothetical protein RL660_1041 [Bacteroidota bacterium]
MSEIRVRMLMKVDSQNVNNYNFMCQKALLSLIKKSRSLYEISASASRRRATFTPMKKIVALFSFLVMFASCDVLQQMNIPLTEADVANGLKDALVQGVNRGAGNLFSVQANGNAGLLNELLPPDVAKALELAKSLGLSPKIEQLSKTLNTAAINSAQKAVPIFVNGIRGMSITDAWGILRGSQNSATQFLRTSTSNNLVAAVTPEVGTVFSSLGLKNTLLENLGSKNQLLKPLDIDMRALLASLVCNKMYDKIGEEEVRIRTDLSARSTALMQRVFAAQTAPAPQPGR